MSSLWKYIIAVLFLGAIITIVLLLFNKDNKDDNSKSSRIVGIWMMNSNSNSTYLSTPQPTEPLHIPFVVFNKDQTGYIGQTHSTKNIQFTYVFDTSSLSGKMNITKDGKEKITKFNVDYSNKLYIQDPITGEMGIFYKQ